MYSRGITSTPSESPSVASAGDKSLRHVGEGALDDSDSSDSAASESVAESHVSEVEHVEVPTPSVPRRSVSRSKARSISAGRVGPAHPSPLSRLAGQQQWIEDEEDEGQAVGMGTGTGTSAMNLKHYIEEDEASPSPVSSDTDDERSDDSDGEVRRRAVTMMSRSRSRKNSRFKSRSRSSTVASLAAPGPLLSLSPARSSPSRPPPTGLGSPTPLHGVLDRTTSQSSVQTVIAVSIREQENEAGVVDSGKEFVEDHEPASWAEMSHERRVAVVEEEVQVREAGWRALREALEEYADEVCRFALIGLRWC